MGLTALESPPLTPEAATLRRPGRRSELRTCWRALWTSRVVVLASGVFAVLQFGRAHSSRFYDPARLTAPFGYLGNLLVAPFGYLGNLLVSPLARWDSVWYLAVAQHGYERTALGAALSYPVTPQPLASLPRYELVLFPLFMWGATRVRRRGIAPQTIAVSAVPLGLFTAEFATWRFVA